MAKYDIGNHVQCKHCTGWISWVLPKEENKEQKYRVNVDASDDVRIYKETQIKFLIKKLHNAVKIIERK